MDSEKFAIAAHMHVVMRRTTGRVTDVEWMVKSPDYAREIIKAARAASHPDLHRLADKLALLLQLVPPANLARTPPPDGRKRYIGTLR